MKRARENHKSQEKSDGDDNGTQPPHRDCDKLYVESATVQCALRNLCVPCAYKIGNFDVALDREFCERVPNQRPEQCCRATNSLSKNGLGYRRGMKVLTVGDGDFSYSVAISRILSQQERLEGKLVATSYENRTTLEQVYPNFLQNLEELERCGAEINFEVDATSLKETLPSVMVGTFDRIVWNFPCTAIESGMDGQNDAMESNKKLVRTFVQNARHFLRRESGEILMCHKTKPPFNQWNFEQVAVEESKDEPVVEYRGRVVLDRFTLPPYSPRKALDRKSFPCHDACTYVFGIVADQQKSLLDSYRLTLSDEETCSEGALGTECSMMKVALDLVETIRTAHLNRKKPKAGKRRKKIHSGKQKYVRRQFVSDNRKI